MNYRHPMIRRALLLPLLGCLVLSVLAGLGLAHVSRLRTMTYLSASTEADARIRLALLESEIARYRLLPLALSDDKDVIAAERDGPQAEAARQTLSEKFARLAKMTGATAIYATNRNGLTLAASNWYKPNSFVGMNYSFRRYFRDARETGTGQQFALGTVSGKPGLYLAHRTRAGGIVVVKLEFDWIEAQWRQAGGITFVTNRSGVVFVTSRPDWRFVATRPLDAQRRDETLLDSGAKAIHPRPWVIRKDGLIAIAGTPGGHLLAGTKADGDGWQLHLAMPASERIEGLARLVGLSGGIVVFALLVLLVWFLQRSRLRRARTQELEQAVVARTAQLRGEMEQRSRLEERAAELREELRLANRLATLGQVTASVAHETAQPVAAIRNYAGAARTLLARGAREEVDENLGAIDRLAERIGVITAELRGFARKRTAATRPTALGEVFEGARLLLRERLQRVDLRFPTLPDDLMVVGDKVRIEQIFVNLLQNALDALAQSDAPRIEIAYRSDGERVVVRVCDNGPGIDPQVAAKLFTPFTTSREEGLGLGLVIAQDIAIEFGGALRWVPPSPPADGAEPASKAAGACFELVLRIAP